LNFIINKFDPRAKILRNKFVFILIPMINIDGVIHGRQRTDTNGVNLNRIYHNPNPDLHPAIFAIRKLINKYAESLQYYFDLHAHVRTRGCFFYGNNLHDDEAQIRNLLFCALAEQNNAALQFRRRNLSASLMDAVDKRGESRSGSGRVQTWELTGRRIVHCYTVECNYHGSHPYQGTIPILHNPAVFRSVGEALAVTILDVEEINPDSNIDKHIRTKSERKCRRIVERGMGC